MRMLDDANAMIKKDVKEIQELALAIMQHVGPNMTDEEVRIVFENSKAIRSLARNLEV